MLITSNRSIGEWGTVFGDAVVVTAILDRAGEPIFDGLIVESVRIEVAEPLLRVVVIGVVRIGEGFELCIEAGDAAAIFRRRRVLAGEVAWVGQSGTGGARLGQGKLVFPAIAHVKV
jgi:hypothetical protein